jgi:CRISPR-associated protein Csm3
MTSVAQEGKLIISGQIELLTGLHIGSGGQNGIGLVDSPVIRHPVTNEPYIPGSSLKGRLRHSLDIISGIDSDKVKKLFGTVPNNQKERCTSRIYVRDAHLSTDDKYKNITEIKYENAISRITGTTDKSKGGLRQIERIVAGTKFNFELVLVLENDNEQCLKDLNSCLKFLEDEYLGASGSRGYGKVKFHFKNLVYKSLASYSGKDSVKDMEINSNEDWSSKAIELIKK